MFVVLFLFSIFTPVAKACCLGGLGVPTPLYSSSSCRACPNGWFDKRRDTDNVPNYHNVRLYICPMAYANFQLYSPGRGSCNSGWYPSKFLQCVCLYCVNMFLTFFLVATVTFLLVATVTFLLVATVTFLLFATVHSVLPVPFRLCR